MKQNQRALLQERVRTLVLTHAIEATLGRLMELGGCEASDELLRLEHRIVAAGRALCATPSEMTLSTMVAVEDALTAIRAVFDRAHERLEAATEAQSVPLAA